MTSCLCGLLLATLSAASADLATTADFTAQGYREANPLARPFVSGRGARGEAWLGGITAGTYLAVDRAIWEPWRSFVLGVAFAVHATLAVRNAQEGKATDVPMITFPVLVLRW
jgi:hypothetical protein